LVKDLIIVRAGKRSLHHGWIDANTPRSWELLISPYEEIPGPPPGVDGLMVSDVIDAPAKFAALKILLNDWQEWRDYRYVMLVDDDVFGTQQTWSLFFDRCAQYGARLAQPALLENSYFSHSVTVRNTEFVARRTSFVETMMPCFRTDIFPEMLSTFGQSASGEAWGNDFLWCKKLGYKDVFVIDETPVLHTRSLRSHSDPELHNRLNAEMAQVMRDNQVPWLLKTFAGVLPGGEEIAEGHPSFLHRLFRGYERLFAQDPRRFDEMIQLQLTTIQKA
jgi:hypothetical protein